MIYPPENCPSCDSLLEWNNDQLYCRNVECPAQSSKQLEHFAKTLKIKGLGPSTIEKLDINSIKDLYEIDLDYIKIQLGSEKLAVKLFDELTKSRKESLNTVLPAFGISLIGKSATDKLAKVCESIFEIDEETCKQAGLGPKATSNLIAWLDTGFYEDLPFDYMFSVNNSVSGVRGIVCISGKLNSYSTKAAATEVLQAAGFIVKDSLTKDVTILVNESGKETAKTEKARASGITIINNLKEYMENI